jgi:hypothetical protein
VGFRLYPNPAGKHIIVEYILSKESKVSITVYNQMGQVVKTLAGEQKQNPGFYQLDFETPELEKGIYFLRIRSGAFNLIEKLIIQ